MSDRARNWLGNLGLLLGALTAVLLFFELVLFRHVLKPDDVIHNVSIDGVVRYVPGTRAVLRHPDKSTSLITMSTSPGRTSD